MHIEIYTTLPEADISLCERLALSGVLLLMFSALTCGYICADCIRSGSFASLTECPRPESQCFRLNLVPSSVRGG